MKHTFAKKFLLFGTLSMLFSSVSVYPMETEPVTQEQISKSVLAYAAQYANWGKEQLHEKLLSTQKFFDRQWKEFMRCFKGQGCTKKQIVAVTGTLALILALVLVLTYGTAYKRGWLESRPWLAKPGKLVGAGLTALGAKAAAAKGAVGEKARALKEKALERFYVPGM